MTQAVVLALVPVVLMIALGTVLRRSGSLADGFWPQAERLGYFVLLPSLFFHGLATADFRALPVSQLAGTLVGATIVVAGLVVAARPLLAIDGPGFTSIFQGSIRFNNYVGVTLAGGLYGVEGIALAALCNAAIVPTANVLCVLVFARYGGTRLPGRVVLRQLATNPLILACLCGIAAQAVGVRIPAGVEPALRALGAASLPLGLLCVGAALEGSGLRGWFGPVALSSVFKFAAMPLVTLAVARLIGLDGQALTTAILFQALPTASSAYILARQLGGDAPLMAGITATQTVLALLALPGILIALAAAGALGP